MLFHGSFSCGCVFLSGYFGGYVRGFRWMLDSESP